jgi:hypothetical protein
MLRFPPNIKTENVQQEQTQKNEANDAITAELDAKKNEQPAEKKMKI